MNEPFYQQLVRDHLGLTEQKCVETDAAVLALAQERSLQGSVFGALLLARSLAQEHNIGKAMAALHSHGISGDPERVITVAVLKVLLDRVFSQNSEVASLFYLFALHNWFIDHDSLNGLQIWPLETMQNLVPAGTHLLVGLSKVAAALAWFSHGEHTAASQRAMVAAGMAVQAAQYVVGYVAAEQGDRLEAELVGDVTDGLAAAARGVRQIKESVDRQGFG